MIIFVLLIHLKEFYPTLASSDCCIDTESHISELDVNGAVYSFIVAPGAQPEVRSHCQPVVDDI